MTGFEARRFRIACARPFSTAKAVTTSVEQLELLIRHGGATGRGVVRCDGMAAGASPDERRAIEQVLRAFDPIHPGSWAAELATALGTGPLAVALDIALYDLTGRLCRQPVRRLLGSPAATGRHTAVSIGVAGHEQAVRAAADYRDWPVVKLKMGPGIGLDTVCAIRAGFDGTLWIDANGTWTLDEAKQLMPRLRDIGVAAVEQPLDPACLDGLDMLRDPDGPLIIADDGITGPSSIAALAGRVDAVNVKLRSCGGIGRARDTIAAARAAGLTVMLGCQTESVAGVTAAAQLAGLADWLDLDGHLDLADDPFAGLTVAQGILTIPDDPGIGVRTTGVNR